jgi:hypothetical protein
MVRDELVLFADTVMSDIGEKLPIELFRVIIVALPTRAVVPAAFLIIPLTSTSAVSVELLKTCIRAE